MNWRAQYRDFMYESIAKVSVCMCEGESSTSWLSHSQLATQTGNLCELCLSVNHFDCCRCCRSCWWHAHAANHSTQSRAEQRNARTHTPNTRSSWCRNRAPYNPQQSLQRGFPQLIFTLSACSFGHINQIQHFSYACAQTNKQHCVHIHSPMHVLFMQ